MSLTAQTILAEMMVVVEHVAVRKVIHAKMEHVFYCVSPIVQVIIVEMMVVAQNVFALKDILVIGMKHVLHRHRIV